MLKNYPATQLFLISILVLLALVLITPLMKDYYNFSAILDSLKFIVKVICGFLLFFTLIDLVDLIHARKQNLFH